LPPSTDDAMCLLVNSTQCDGTNKGSCRMDCSPDPWATESECVSKGCCWEEVRDGEGNPVPGLPWCFYPGGAPKCIDGQAEKDADLAVKDAEQAYHKEGTKATEDAYRGACEARGDRFYSFFVTPYIWVDDGTTSQWADTRVTLIKYGCNAAACGEADIKHIVHRIEAGQDENDFQSGRHASWKFNVTGYSIGASPPKGESDKVNTAEVVVIVTATVLVLVGLVFAACYFMRRCQDTGDALDMTGSQYARKDSFRVPDSLSPKAVVCRVGSEESPRTSLVNNGM